MPKTLVARVLTYLNEIKVLRIERRVEFAPRSAENPLFSSLYPISECEKGSAGICLSQK